MMEHKFSTLDFTSIPYIDADVSDTANSPAKPSTIIQYNQVKKSSRKSSIDYLTSQINKNLRKSIRYSCILDEPLQTNETDWPYTRKRQKNHLSTCSYENHKLSFDYASNDTYKNRLSSTSLLSERLHRATTNAAQGTNPAVTRSVFLKEQFQAFFQPSDNKLTMKLFGNKQALDKEKQRQIQQGHWVIHPCSSFRFYWDLMMLGLLIANLIILPVAISFFNDDLSLKWVVFNCLSDTIFLIDIAVNFRTGVVLNNYADEIILTPSDIAKHYIRSWFILDLVSSIPLDYIFMIINDDSKVQSVLHAGRAIRMLRLVKLLSLIRLLRISRLVRYVYQWEELLNIASKFLRIFNLVLLMILLGHWNACLQFLIPMLSDFPADCWVAKCNLQKASWFHQYTWALFKAMSHMLSIGYGRYPPTSVSEAWITIVSMITGATCYALFVGHAAALIQSFDTSKRLYREKFKQVEEYMAYRKLPRNLRQKISNYYEYRYQGKMFNERNILRELSECLREEIINFNCRGLVAAVPFFTYADPNFVSDVVVKLRYEVFQPGDVIIKEGTIGDRMYFIHEGVVDIVMNSGEVVTSLSDGSYFGEICLLCNVRRVASVQAVTYCHMYSLEMRSFQAVLEHYPLMRHTMEGVAAERLIKIGRNPLLISDKHRLKEGLDLVKDIVHNSHDDDKETENKETVVKESSNKTRFNKQRLKRNRRNHRKSTIQISLEKVVSEFTKNRRFSAFPTINSSKNVGTIIDKETSSSHMIGECDAEC